MLECMNWEKMNRKDIKVLRILAQETLSQLEYEVNQYLADYWDLYGELHSEKYNDQTLYIQSVVKVLSR